MIKNALLIGMVCAASTFAIEQKLSSLFESLYEKMAPADPVSCAVLPFSVGENIDEKESGKLIAKYGVLFLSTQPSVTVVEREKIGVVARELALSQTGLTDQDAALEAGKMVNARIIITGAVTEAMGNRLISCRAIEVETGTVIAFATVSVEPSTLAQFYQEALSERLKPSSSIFRSVGIPGWGQFYADHPGHGLFFSLCAAGGMGTLVWSIIDLVGAQQDVNAFNNLQNFIHGETPEERNARERKAHEIRDDAATRTGIIGAVLGGVWVVNILDAAILGKIESRRVTDLYLSYLPDRRTTTLSLNIAF